jgi:hypothetical protein
VLGFLVANAFEVGDRQRLTGAFSSARHFITIASYSRVPVRSNAQRSPSRSISTSGLRPLNLLRPVVTTPRKVAGGGTEPIRSASCTYWLRSERWRSVRPRARGHR